MNKNLINYYSNKGGSTSKFAPALEAYKSGDEALGKQLADQEITKLEDKYAGKFNLKKMSDFSQGASQTDYGPSDATKTITTPTLKSGTMTQMSDVLTAKQAKDSANLGEIDTSKTSLLNYPVTSTFNSKEGFRTVAHRGTDFAAPKGTPLTAPGSEEDQWEVVQAYGEATTDGPNNPNKKNENSGWGNSVVMRNMKTGEEIRTSHMDVNGVYVTPGQIITGGTVIGKSGATGNVVGNTGEHVDVEYKNSQGQLQDITKTGYLTTL
jgi:murein DD-endopeptidase MepM/ murein hydrolase activator NlpD